MNILGEVFGKEKDVEKELATIKESIQELNTKGTERSINVLIA